MVFNPEQLMFRQNRHFPHNRQHFQTYFFLLYSEGELPRAPASCISYCEIAFYEFLLIMSYKIPFIIPIFELHDLLGQLAVAPGLFYRSEMRPLVTMLLAFVVWTLNELKQGFISLPAPSQLYGKP